MEWIAHAVQFWFANCLFDMTGLKGLDFLFRIEGEEGLNTVVSIKLGGFLSNHQ